MCTLSTKMSVVEVRGGGLGLWGRKMYHGRSFLRGISIHGWFKVARAYQRPWVRCGTSTLVNCDLSSDSCRIDVLYRREVAVGAH